MGALDGVDAIELHEAELVDQRVKVCLGERMCAAICQRVAIQKEGAGGGIADLEFCFGHCPRGSNTYSSFNPSGSANITA